MTMAWFAIASGILLLIWSAERFVEGSASVARNLGMPPLLIGMVVVGFGTSAPEMAVSALAAFQGNPGLALGNAYGSNITNIALILGVTALISPIAVHSQVLRKELPILAAVTILAAFQLWNGELSRVDSLVLLGLFAALMGWTIRQGLRQRVDSLGRGVEEGLEVKEMTLRRAFFWMGAGLVLLVFSSRLLVWGSIEIARSLGISDLVIGLTIVAVGTSLPELASSLSAVRRGEHDLALGNILGSNLFNTLAVVGIAGTIHPFAVEREVLTRDIPVMGFLTLLLFAVGYRFRGAGRINRVEGAALLACFISYTIYLVFSTVAG